MSSASGSRSALQRGGLRFPRIQCPDCHRVVTKCVSTSEEHPGWVYYKCDKHGIGCNFWHWELEYILYLVENAHIRGNVAVEAVGWAEDRREELLLRKEEQSLAGATSAVRQVQVHDRLVRQVLRAEDQKMLDAVTKLVLLLKIIAGLLCVLCVLIALKK